MRRVPIAVLVILVVSAPAVGQGDPSPVAPAAPVYTDYEGADREAAQDVRRRWADAPKRPARPPVKPDGTVTREHWDVYQKALREYAEAMKVHYAAIVPKAVAFLDLYPGSQYEMEMAKATLTALAKAERWRDLIAIADAFRTRYGASLEMSCWQMKGDALDRLHRFDRAAEAHARYYAAAGNDVRKAMRAAMKHVQALIRAGREDEAKRVGATYCEAMPRAAAFIRAQLLEIELIGRPLPQTPDVRLHPSGEEVNWGRPRDRPTVVLLWSTQYVEGERAIRGLMRIRAHLRDLPFHVVALGFEEQATPESVEAWLGRNDVTDVDLVPQRGRVSQSAVGNAWGLCDREKEIAIRLPLAILLDRRGIVRHVGCPVGPYLEVLLRRVAARDG